MPLSSTVRLAALLATLVRSDISLSVGDAGIELSSNTSRNLSKDNSTGTDQPPPGSTEHFEGPDKDFIIVENRLNIKCYQQKQAAPGSFVEMSRASDRKKKISREGKSAEGRVPPRDGEAEEGGEEFDEEDDLDRVSGDEDRREDDQAGLSGDEYRDPHDIAALPDADTGLEGPGEEEDTDGGNEHQLVPAAAQDPGAGGGGLVKSKKLPENPVECPDHEATQDEDKVKCDALEDLVLITEGEHNGKPLLYEVNCEENKAKVEELIGLAQTRIKEAQDAIEAVKAEEAKLNKLIDAEKKKADGSVVALGAIKDALEKLSPDGIDAFVAAIATDKIFLPPTDA